MIYFDQIVHDCFLKSLDYFSKKSPETKFNNIRMNKYNDDDAIYVCDGGWPLFKIYLKKFFYDDMLRRFKEYEFVIESVSYTPIFKSVRLNMGSNYSSRSISKFLDFYFFDFFENYSGIKA